MGSNLITGNALLIAGLLPLLQVAIGAAAFWQQLKRPVLFIVVGLVVLYPIMVACVSPTLSKIGIVGVRPGAPPPPVLGPADIKLLFAFGIFVAIGCAVLWGLKLVFAKP